MGNRASLFRDCQNWKNERMNWYSRHHVYADMRDPSR